MVLSYRVFIDCNSFKTSHTSGLISHKNLAGLKYRENRKQDKHNQSGFSQHHHPDNHKRPQDRRRLHLYSDGMRIESSQYNIGGECHPVHGLIEYPGHSSQACAPSTTS